MQTLTIKTDIKCQPSSIERCRKKIIAQVLDILGKDSAHDLFHNHVEDKELHRYPLVQYRSKKSRLEVFACGVAIPVIGQAIMAADPENENHLLHINNTSLVKRKASFCRSERNEYYRLMDWIALNNENYNQKWLRTFSLTDRVSLLNHALTRHLQSVAELFLPEEACREIQGELFMITNRKNQQAFGTTLMGLNVIFKTPWLLPESFALGRCVSIGAGTFEKLTNHPENDKRITQN